MFRWFKRLFYKVFKKHSVKYEDIKRDNTPKNPLPSLPEHKTPIIPSAGYLWYPKRVVTNVSKLKMRTRGYYKNGFPEGAIVHFTSGRSRAKKEGGTRNKTTHLENGIMGVEQAIDKGSYCYFIIDRSGNVFQNFPLDRWGYHAGKSKCPLTKRSSVSKYYVGIEIQGAGRVKKVDSNRFMAWFTRPERGDRYFYKESGEVKYFKDKENIQRGYYHLYSDEQRDALVSLLLWMDNAGKGFFELSKVFGHDEVAPDRKEDPGGSLDMTMSSFRSMVQDIKKEEGL